MPIYADKNLYNGVNPHLNSFLQNPLKRWEGFHTRFIVFLAAALDQHLPPGYHSEAEEGLQISQVTPPTRRRKSSLSKADVLIYGEPNGSTLALVELEAEAEYLAGIVIYRAEPSDEFGNPVTRMELLSPANKAGGSHHEQYLRKRRESLQSGLNFVEIDFLHQLPPIVSSRPSYANREPDAYPFLVFVNDPHPAFEEGRITVYGSHVDQELPRIRLPLAGDDFITFDLNVPYNQTCSTWRTFQNIDHEQLPLAFERYSADDQARIRARMQQINTDQP